MKERIIDKKLIAACGLYCGGCKKYFLEKCPGCSQNEKASWCAIRNCCLERKIQSCADCHDYRDTKECPKYDNFIAKFFSFIFGSDRPASIKYIKANGYDEYAEEMNRRKKMCIKKGE